MKTKSLFTKDFTLVVIGQIISLFGNAILRFALPLYLLRETNSPTLFGIVTACSFLPMVVLSFFGGILADRVNKRNIMVILDFLTAGIILILYFILGTLPVAALLTVVMMLLYGISGTYQPAVQASIPALVEESRILPASAVVNQISSLASLLGPILGGMLFGAFGIYPILIISVLCFFASAVMEIFIHIPFEKRSENLGAVAIVKQDIRESVQYMKKEKPVLLKIIGLVALFNLVLSAMIMVGIPVLIVEILGLSDELLGFAQGALALGGLCGGILTAVLSKKLTLASSASYLMVCCLLLGAMAIPIILGMNAMVIYWVLTLACFGMMVLATMFTVQMIATVQQETPPQLVGKVIAFMMAISMSAQPIGQAIYGVIFDQLSGQIGYVILAVGLIALVLVFLSRKVFRKAV